MCGIAGIVTPSQSSLRRGKVRRMVDLLKHRGPDDNGIYEDFEVCLGHARLAIIDLTAAAHQPMIEGQNVLVYNGEIYNYTELRSQLENLGVTFQSFSDTEVLLKGYRVWGRDVVQKLKGMFSFAIWDADRRRLFCGRDPFGKKPFYYYWRDQKFIFASEVEAVVAGLDSRPTPDYDGISHYLLKGHFASGKSVYEDIYTLQAGCCLEIDVREKTLREWRYWLGAFQLGRTSDTFVSNMPEVCNDLIGSAVQRRFQSDVPVGVLLSGGVDSSLVTLNAVERLGHDVTTFTATFGGNDLNEAFYANQVATRAGSNHKEVPVEMDNTQDALSRLVEIYGEPFGDYSAIPTTYLFEGLKPYVKVVLTGDGGDETFAGYKDVRLFLFRRALIKLVGAGNILSRDRVDNLLYSKREKLRQLGHALIALRSEGAAAFYSLYRGGWTEFWRSRLMRPEAWRYTGESALELTEAEQFLLSGRNDLERYLNSSLERLTQLFMVKIDRASMAHSIEARCPFLDVDLFDWASGLPKEAMLAGGEPKSILKDVLAKWMGDGFARRSKMGFTPPLEAWLRQTDVSQWMERRLTDKESLIYELFDPDGIRRMIQLHKNGYDHTSRLWKLLFLDAWHVRFY